MFKLLAFTLRMLKDQRGEVGDDDDSGPDVDDNINDDDVIEIDPDDLEDDPEEDLEDDPEEDLENDPEKSPVPGDEDLKAKVTTLETELAKRDEEIKEMNRNFYGLRKKLKAIETKPDDKAVTFTDAQLEDMIEEQRDDPKAIVQIMKHVAKQISTGEAENQTAAFEVSQRKKELEEHLVSAWPDVHNEGTQTHQDVQHAKDFLHVADHPLGDFIGAAGMMFLQMPKMIEDAKKEGRETAIKTEDVRKKTIKENSLESGKKKIGKTEMSTNHRSTAKQLGLSKTQKKIYVQLLNQSKTASVEV